MNFAQLDSNTRQELIRYLNQFITPRRQATIQEVLAQRTRYVAVVLENIYRPHNASAVLRSCECLGIQDVHIIEDAHQFQPNKKIVHGASRWLTLHRYRQGDDGTRACLARLRQQQYCLVATTLRADSVPISELDLSRPVALCFGTEGDGLSDVAHDMADVFVRIPMVGFTQSFNISVTAALFLYDLTRRLRQSTLPWTLTEADKEALTAEWSMRSLHQGTSVVRRFMTAQD